MMLDNPAFKQIVEEVNRWETQRIITRHNDAAHVLHKLVFLADLGIPANVLEQGIEAILKHQSEEGPFQVRIMIPKAFGGDDKEDWNWVATDAPLIVYSLLRFGLQSEPRVQKAAEYLAEQVNEDGYHCFTSHSFPKFNGPGRKNDPCPYANLIMLRMFSQLDAWRDSPEAHHAANMLLHHWEVQKEKKYKMFGIGTDFRKLKAPLIWYDILHVLDTLSQFPWVHTDPRFLEMVACLLTKADEQHRFRPESVWMKWKGWDFAQKRNPSPWITFLSHRILQRLE